MTAKEELTAIPRLAELLRQASEPKPESNPPPPAQHAQANKQAAIEALQKVFLDPKSKTLDKTRAAETLECLAEYSWYAKPKTRRSQTM